MAKSSSGVSFDGCQKQCSEILSAAGRGEYSQVYLLHGAEGYFIDKVESYITSNAIDEGSRDFNQSVIYGKESSGSEVVAVARRYPMFGERQLVVVREAQSLKNLADLAHYLDNVMPSTILVVAHRDKTLDKRSPLYKKFAALAAKGEAVVLESVSPKEWEVLRFVGNLLKEKGLRMSNDAQQMIADNIGTNLIRISQELDKLVVRLGSEAVVGAGGREITAEDVEANIGISRKFNNFELTKALSYRQFDKALSIAGHLSANSKENPFVLTISALFTHFQRVTTLGFIYYEVRQSGQPMPQDMELARRIKIPSAFFLDEYKVAVRNYSLAKCVQILSLIREFDMKSKGIGGGSSTEGELLRDLLLRISLL